MSEYPKPIPKILRDRIRFYVESATYSEILEGHGFRIYYDIQGHLWQFTHLATGLNIYGKDVSVSDTQVIVFGDTNRQDSWQFRQINGMIPLDLFEDVEDMI